MFFYAWILFFRQCGQAKDAWRGGQGWWRTRPQAARAVGIVRRRFGAPPMRQGRVIPHSDGKVFGVILTRMKITPKKELTSGDLIFDFFREGKIRMNQTNGPVNRIKIGLGIALLAALTGCVGYVDGGYVGEGYGGAVVVAEPDVYIFGGGYERGRDVHDYSRRGGESRAAAHPSGGGQRGKR